MILAFKLPEEVFGLTVTVLAQAVVRKEKHRGE